MSKFNEIYDELFPNAYKGTTPPYALVRKALVALASTTGQDAEDAEALLRDPDWVIYYP